MTVTLSGSTGTLYVNGTAVGTNTNMTLNPAALGDTTNDWIGHSQYPADPYLDGEIDDFNIYNSALSASQIATLASGQPGAGNVADYKFDETGGATAVDSSGNKRNGTIISDPVVPSTMTPTRSSGAGRHRVADPHRQHLAAQLPGVASDNDRHRLEHQHRGDTIQPGRVRHRGGAGRGRLRTGSDHDDLQRRRAEDRRLPAVHVRRQRCAASDVSSPRNVFLRVDGGGPQQVGLRSATTG